MAQELESLASAEIDIEALAEKDREDAVLQDKHGRTAREAATMPQSLHASRSNRPEERVTAAWQAEVSFSTPYMDETLAFITEDFRRRDFSSWETLAKLENLRIGIGRNAVFRPQVEARLPNAEIVALDPLREYFQGAREDLDAVIRSTPHSSKSLDVLSVGILE